MKPLHESGTKRRTRQQSRETKLLLGHGEQRGAIHGYRLTTYHAVIYESPRPSARDDRQIFVITQQSTRP